MDSNISLNSEPLIWITVDETYDPATSECHWVARRSDFKDYLIPLSEFDGGVPTDYWDR